MASAMAPNCQRLAGFGNIMNPQVLDALGNSEKRGGNRTANAAVGRLGAINPPNEALARSAEHHGTAQTMKNPQIAHQQCDVPDLLPEPDAWVDNDLARRNSVRQTSRNASLQIIGDVEPNVLVARRILHGLRRSEAVHQDDGAA